MTPTPPSIPNILRQAVYLGMSWTWCIGMFLPVLLIRDYGHWAWWVFAIPNIVGAAAMGWVVRSREQSVDYVRNHETAVRVFSLVTITFQFFFVFWMVRQLAGPYVTILGLVAAGGGAFAVRRFVSSICVLALLVSTTLWLLAGSNLSYPPSSPPTLNLLWLTLSCLAGFLTCPYLDLTFHRARQQCSTSTESKWAFALGFGLFFAAMIVFTLLYATNLLNNATLARYVGIHMALQAGLTIALHWHVLEALPPLTDWRKLFNVLPVMVAMALGLSTVAPSGETTYRLFMSFYALVFPAYVIIHLKAGQRKHWYLLIATLAVAGPMFYAAFIAGYMIWLLPGTATLLVAYIAADVIRQRPATAPPPPTLSAPR